jgi:hypothetical protein
MCFTLCAGDETGVLMSPKRGSFDSKAIPGPKGLPSRARMRLRTLAAHSASPVEEVVDNKSGVHSTAAAEEAQPVVEERRGTARGRRPAALTPAEAALQQRFNVRRIFLADIHGLISGLQGATRPDFANDAIKTAFGRENGSISPTHSSVASPRAGGDGLGISEPPSPRRNVKSEGGNGQTSPSNFTASVTHRSVSHTVSEPIRPEPRQASNVRAALKISRIQGFGGELPFLGNGAPNAVYQTYNYSTMATSMAEVEMYKDSSSGGPTASQVAFVMTTRTTSPAKHMNEGEATSRKDKHDSAGQQAAADAEVDGITGLGHTLTGSTAARYAALTVADKRALREILLEKERFANGLAPMSKEHDAPDAYSAVAERRVEWMQDMLRHDHVVMHRLMQRVEAIKRERSEKYAGEVIMHRNMSSPALHLRSREMLASRASLFWQEEMDRAAAARDKRDGLMSAWDAYIHDLMNRHVVHALSRETRERQMTWAFVVNLARVASLLQRAVLVERMVTHNNQAAKKAAIIIQARFRGRHTRRFAHNLLATRKKLSRFVWHWRMRRNIQRKRNAALFISRFFNTVVLPEDSSSVACSLYKYIKHFRHSVVKAQQYARAFLACLRARKLALHLLWNKVKAITSHLEGRKPKLPPLVLSPSSALNASAPTARKEPPTVTIASATDEQRDDVLHQYRRFKRHELTHRREAWVRTTARHLLHRLEAEYVLPCLRCPICSSS